MAEQDELRELVESLSENEVDNLELRRKIARLVEEADTAEVNKLPVLYRIEIKKTLERLDRKSIASSIEV